MKTIDVEAASDRYLKALVYGPPGTGKTNLGVSAPKPLILLSEHQAVPHMRAAAKRLGVPAPLVLAMDNLKDYRHVLVALRADKAQPFTVRDDDGNVVFQSAEWPETVVLDSLTDACELVSAEIRAESPPKVGKDGLPVDSERYWNVLADRCAKLIRAFRDLPINTLFLCLVDDRMVGEGDEAKRVVQPMLPMRKLPMTVMAAVNVVGVTYRKRGDAGKDGKRPMVYGIQTAGPDYVALKPFPPLRDQEVTDFSSWCKRIAGIDDGSIAPEAPEHNPITNSLEAPAAPTEKTKADKKSKEI